MTDLTLTPELIHFKSPHCNAKNVAAEEAAGRKGRCTGCEKVTRVPEKFALWLEPKVPHPAPRRGGRTRHRGRASSDKDLAHLAHVRAIAAWLGLGAALLLLIAGLTAVYLGAAAVSARHAQASKVLFVLLLGGGLASVGVFLGFLARGLWRLKQWARYTFGALALLSALHALVIIWTDPRLVMIVPRVVSLFWTAASLHILFGETSRGVFQRCRTTPVRWWASPLAWGQLLTGILATAVVFALGM